MVKFSQIQAFWMAILTPLANADPAVSPDSGKEAQKIEKKEQAPAIKSLGGTLHELNGIQFDRKTRSISLPATINMTEGLLEYALVHESGKVHESLLSTAVSPFDLNVVLLLLNYQPSAAFFDHRDKKAGAVLVKNPKIEPQAKVSVTLEWKDSAGLPKTAPLESMLINLDQKGPAKEGPFIYTGSMLMEDGNFMAKETGSIVALYADAAALINNPREGNENDDAWICDPKKVPAKNTRVTVILSPAPK